MGNVCGSPSADQPVKKAETGVNAPPQAQTVDTKSTPKDVTTAKDDIKNNEGAVPPADSGAGSATPTSQPAATVTDAASKQLQSASPESIVPAVVAKTKSIKVFVVFYSTYGHILQLARAYKAALESVEGVVAELYQVPEILPASVLEKMHAPPKAADIPVLDPHNLPMADALVFGFPTRFGMMASQMKSFFDATGGLWQKGELHGKPASMFTSTASQGGGQETTLMTAVTQLAHHGMIYVPTGYAAGAAMFGVTEAKGGSPWGAGTLAGPDGSRQPSEVELEALAVQAKLFGQTAKKLAA